MSKQLILRCGHEPLVEFPAENCTVSVRLTEVSGHLFRLDSVPIGVEAAAYGDTVELESGDAGRFRFVRVAEPGGWRTYDYIVPSYKIDGEWGQSLLRELEQRGGHWERVLGGILFVCVPPDVDLDPTPWVESACSWRL